jgi:hypothetical protein
MDQKGDEDGNGVCILRERYGNSVDKDWNQDTSTSACHYHVDKLVGEGCIAADGTENLGTYER